MSKGSSRRPATVNSDQVAQNWQRIFGKKPPTPPPKPAEKPNNTK